jgi:hypothetical protein
MASLPNHQSTSLAWRGSGARAASRAASKRREQAIPVGILWRRATQAGAWDGCWGQIELRGASRLTTRSGLAGGAAGGTTAPLTRRQVARVGKTLRRRRLAPPASALFGSDSIGPPQSILVEAISPWAVERGASSRSATSIRATHCRSSEVALGRRHPKTSRSAATHDVFIGVVIPLPWDPLGIGFGDKPEDSRGDPGVLQGRGARRRETQPACTESWLLGSFPATASCSSIHGKEVVDGSSPSAGSAKDQQMALSVGPRRGDCGGGATNPSPGPVPSAP